MSETPTRSPISSPRMLASGAEFPAWFAAVAQSGKVLVARDALIAARDAEPDEPKHIPQLLDAYAPAIKQTRRIYGEDREIETPVMGRYFFVRLVLDQAGAWARARYVRGVQALLPTHSLRPLRIPDRLIDQVKADVESGRFSPPELVRMLRRFLAGEDVDVISGRMLIAYPHGISGKVESHSLRHGVKVKLYCEDGEKVVTLPAEQLAPSSGSARRQTRPGGFRRRQRMRDHQPARAAV